MSVRVPGPGTKIMTHGNSLKISRGKIPPDNIPQGDIPFAAPQLRSGDGTVIFNQNTNQVLVSSDFRARPRPGEYIPSVLMPTNPEQLGGIPLQVAIPEGANADDLAREIAKRIGIHGYGFSHRSDFWRGITAVAVAGKTGKAGKDHAIVQLIDVSALIEADYQQQKLGLKLTAAPLNKSGVSISPSPHNPNRFQIRVPSGDAEVDVVAGRTDGASENFRVSVALPDGSKVTPESLRGKTAYDVALAISAVINRAEDSSLRAAPVHNPNDATTSEVYVFDAAKLANELSR
jgi:hypothetical protein